MRHEQFQHDFAPKFQRNWYETGVTGDPIHTGDWGTLDIGLTELLQRILQGNDAQYNYNQQGGSSLTSSPAGGGPVISPINESAQNDINQTQAEDAWSAANTPTGGGVTTGGGGGGGGGTPSGGGGIDFNALLDMAFNRARGVYNEGMGALSGKRKQFSDIHEQGKTDILQGFEKGAGELQSSATGARERNAQALRALGLGGSAVVRTQGRERQNEMKALGGLQDIRGKNERGNDEAYQANTDWANSQESGLRRGMSDASTARSTGAVSLLDNILNNQMAYNASIGAKTATPYNVNIPSMVGSLTGIASDAGLMGGGQQDQNVNIDPNEALLALLRKRGGVSGAGLYA